MSWVRMSRGKAAVSQVAESLARSLPSSRTTHPPSYLSAHPPACLPINEQREVEAPRRREGVAGAEERIRLLIRREERRCGDRRQVEELLDVGRELRLVVEDVEQPGLDRHAGAAVDRQSIRSHQIEVGPRRV